jgi:hypothetical protein
MLNIEIFEEEEMKDTNRILLSFLLIGLLVTACTGAQQAQSSNLAATDELAIFSQGLIEAEQDTPQQFPTATRYELQLTLTEPYAEVEGQEQITYWNNEDVVLEEIYLRMFPNNAGDTMVVSKLLVAEEESPINIEYENTALRVDLPAALQPGESVILDLTYTVQIPTDFGGNYGLFSYMDGVLALDQVYAIIPVYDDEGWNVEIPALNGDMIYADPAFFSVTIQAPADLVIASSGVVVEEQEKGGMKTQTVLAGPVRDFYLAASTNYRVVSEQVGETLVTSYYPSEYEEGGEFALQVGVNALKSFNECFGTYPYTELDLVSTPMQAGGMEYSGIVAMGIQYYDASQNYSGMPALTILESVTAHEVGHEWFFNLVMNDQIDEPWIDEGMAQYLASLYYEDTYGITAAQSYQDSWEARWNRAGHAAIPIGLPVREYDEAEYSAIIYGRAPLFIQSLREKMGDAVFFDFLKTLFEKYEWGILTTEEFRALAEEACGCDLQEDFETWVYAQ